MSLLAAAGIRCDTSGTIRLNDSAAATFNGSPWSKTPRCAPSAVDQPCPRPPFPYLPPPLPTHRPKLESLADCGESLTPSVLPRYGLSRTQTIVADCSPREASLPALCGPCCPTLRLDGGQMHTSAWQPSYVLVSCAFRRGPPAASPTESGMSHVAAVSTSSIS